MRNKKGQEMSVTTLILIVLGVVLLVLLILGFSMGWTNLWNKINIFQGGSTVDSMVQACNIAGTSDGFASFCEFKLVTIDGVKQYVNCQDSNVASKVDKALACPAGNNEASAGVYCGKLYVGTASDKVAFLKTDAWMKTLYNQKTCDKYVGESKVKDASGKVLSYISDPADPTATILG